MMTDSKSHMDRVDKHVVQLRNTLLASQVYPSPNTFVREDLIGMRQREYNSTMRALNAKISSGFTKIWPLRDNNNADIEKFPGTFVDLLEGKGE